MIKERIDINSPAMKEEFLKWLEARIKKYGYSTDDAPDYYLKAYKSGDPHDLESSLWTEWYNYNNQWNPERDVRPITPRSKEGYSEFQQWVLIHAEKENPNELKGYLKESFEADNCSSLPPPAGAKYFEWLMGREGTIEEIASLGINIGSTPNSFRDDGYVYVIQDIESSLYKIGITIDPERRLKELGVGNSAVLISCDYYPNAKEIEKTSHKRYAEFRLPQTEYFKLNQPPEIY